MHAYGYGNALNQIPEAVNVGVWDSDSERSRKFAERFNTQSFDSMDLLLSNVDAVIVTSENVEHARYGIAAAKAGKSVLCEKPLVTSEEDAQSLLDAVSLFGVVLMTAFPCRFSPAFQRLKERCATGEIGAIKAVCATNRGTCPHDWFVDRAKSGGGAMIDHTVHVADLLRDLLQSEVRQVHATTGNRMYGQEWEDTAMLSLTFENGVIATLDSSWSRPSSYKTWGDVTMTVVCESGVIELDMFTQSLDAYRNESMRHGMVGWGSDLDLLLTRAFVQSVGNRSEPPVTGQDGWKAAQVALAGYESVRSGQPVSLA